MPRDRLRSCIPLRVLIGSAALALALPAQTAIPFPRTPSYESDRAGVSTGGAFADLNRDGWPDLVIANGNDILRQSVAVYYNKGDGTFPVNPDWKSQDVDYHGHLDIGDVNGDGWLDVVVGVYLGPSGWNDPGAAKLYLNDGKGRLGNLPSWISTDRFHCFSVALGDVDQDGDLDLAVATGEAYQAQPDNERLFLNTAGTFSAKADWVSAVKSHSYDVTWGDVDGDGDLDLGFVCARSANMVYLNDSGKLRTSPSWTSTDGGTQRDGNTCIFADIDGDGRPDFVASDNSQLSGRGTFRVYRNLGGTFTTTPWWESARFHNGYTSALNVLDFDRDGDLDLVAGGWWTQTAIYRNQNGVLPTTPTWETTGTSVVEAIFFADLDRDGLRPVIAEAKTLISGRRLYHLDRGPVQAITKVTVDGVPVGPDKYAAHLEGGWISLAATPTTSLSVDYVYSEACEIGVSNWDQDKGNYVFRRSPVFTLALTPPARTWYREGEVVTWSERIESTVDNPQLLLYRSTLEVPRFGPVPFFAGALTVPGAWSATLPLAFPLPDPLPLVLLGGWGYKVELLGPTQSVVARGSFAFTAQPKEW